jgi:hypothetical protein
MLGHSVDNDLLTITLIAYPPNKKQKKGSKAAKRGSMQASGDIEGEARLTEVGAQHTGKYEERPAAGDPAFDAIKRAQNEHAFRVPCVLPTSTFIPNALPPRCASSELSSRFVVVILKMSCFETTAFLHPPCGMQQCLCYLLGMY